MATLGNYVKTVKHSTIGLWIILIFFFLVGSVLGAIWAGLHLVPGDGKIQLGGGTTFDIGEFKKSENQMIDVKVNRYGIKTLHMSMEQALAMSTVIVFAFVLLFFIIIRSTPKQVVDLHEYGMMVRDRGISEEILYEDIPYSLARLHRGFLLVLGFKVTPESPWIVTSGSVAESLMATYQKARSHKSMELFDSHAMVPFITGHVGMIRNAFRTGLSGLFPKTVAVFALGKEHSEFNGKTYKNSELTWNITDTTCTVSMAGTVLFSANFENISNPDICYELLQRIGV